jgi:hypothetical protein
MCGRWKALAPRIVRGQGRRRLRKTNQAAALCRVTGVGRSHTSTNTGNARRILGMLRAKTAKNKPAGPTIAEYIAAKQAEKAANAPDGDAA